ncbi:glycosyltransferase family 4 protein [Paenibacillus rhizovicinus]|uniref:Glycosyltransferase family 4 protein n=1 Tax=Paenibacillus rhizovicinus TaxID=2704463 RepID=A0A6C0NUL3_9BACL|nr:glycosyltransferase family 4 protein [Paenibacillus rhizovicinus]QHW29848.1 glycosyltransferase family 4 protein [Paenibacillus rhizovicinus]
MKILITTDTYSPVINGVVTSVNHLYNELKQAGHDVRILTLSPTGRDMTVGDIYYVKSIRTGIYPDARVKIPFFNKLLREVIAWEPDVIHSQTEFSMMLASRSIANKLNIPHVHTYHTMYENYLDYVWFGIISKNVSAIITRKLLNPLDGIITATNKTRKTLIGYGVSKPIHVIPTGIALREFQQTMSPEECRQIKADLGIGEQDRLIAFVGRIAEEKNISELLTLLPEVIRKHESVKLLIVGGGPYAAILEEQIRELGLEKHVIMTGMVPPADVYKYYKTAEIFVNASTSETQGLTYIEALSSGCPVVCKYDPCIDGVIEQGFNGYAYRKPSEFAPYIHAILSDVELRERMSDNALSKANEYSSSVFANHVLDTYTSVLRASREARVPFAQRLKFIVRRR